MSLGIVSCILEEREKKVKRERVCVTGAGGFIASWLVKMLLSRGYTVRGTVRNPDDVKYAHLKELEGARERLELVKADILDYDSLITTIRGCKGVFHTACPMTEDPVKVMEGTVNGTLNVLKASKEERVKRVIHTSTIVLFNSTLTGIRKTLSTKSAGATLIITFKPRIGIAMQG